MITIARLAVVKVSRVKLLLVDFRAHKWDVMIEADIGEVDLANLLTVDQHQMTMTSTTIIPASIFDMETRSLKMDALLVYQA